jgi:uroporphyrinogen decarboxylase
MPLVAAVWPCLCLTGAPLDTAVSSVRSLADPVRSMDDVKQLRPLLDPTTSLPFTGEILSTLRQEVTSETALLGFIGAPWTLAAYAIEGKSERHCLQTKVCDERS